MQRSCRHLLRHLDDPHALATNDLVAPLFRESREPHHARGAVRALLRAAANDLRAGDRGQTDETALRHHAILTRCDLAGEPHKQVAAQLGLSMRHFYRERQSMIDWLAEYLTHRLGTSRNVVASAIDVSALELARARALQHGGYSTLALVLLRSIAESGAEPAIVVAAGCQYVSVVLEQNDFAQAGEQLNALERYLNEKDLNDPAGLETQRVALERRNLHAFSGDERLALELDAQALPFVRELGRSRNPAAQEFAVNALTFAARRLFMSGHYQEAQSALEEARDVLLKLREHAPADLEISLLILYGALLATTRRLPESASLSLREAAALAARHGASELAVLAAIGLSIDDQMHGDGQSALRRVRETLPLAGKVASPLNYAHLCLRAGELEIEAGDVTRARAMLDEAEQDLIEGTYGWTYLTLLRAHLYLAEREFPRAKECVERAVAAAERQKNDRVCGVALRALAESYIGMNARSAAIDAIERAIEKLERCGYPRALAAAYRVAAKLTGREKYVRAAEDVEQTLESA